MALIKCPEEKKDTYTYKEILLGLRDEILDTEHKLRELKAYSIVDENSVSKYFYHLSKPSDAALPELRATLTKQQTALMKKLSGLLSHFTDYSSQQSALMAKNNNGAYYQLGNPPIKLRVKPEKKAEFNQLATEILQSRYANEMNFSEVISTTPDHHEIIETIDFEPYLRLMRLYSGIHVTYVGRTDTIRFISTPRTPLTPALLNEMLRIEFPKEKFSEYHQEIIERNVDDRPVVLPETYIPTASGEFQIIDYSYPDKILLKERKQRKK